MINTHHLQIKWLCNKYIIKILALYFMCYCTSFEMYMGPKNVFETTGKASTLIKIFIFPLLSVNINIFIYIFLPPK